MAQKFPPIQISIPVKNVKSNQHVKFPDMITIIAGNGVYLLAFNSEIDQYEKALFSRNSGLVDGVYCGKDLYLFKHNEVIRLNEKFEKVDSRKLKKIDSIATDDRNVFLSANGFFIALDPELNVLSKVSLKCHDSNKNAHDILLYKKTAYLLDNIIYPIFVFKVDISNPASMSISGQVEFEGINPHLDMQWINPAKGHWNIVESFDVHGGSGQIAHIFPLNGSGKEISQQTLYERVIESKSKDKGQKLFAVTPIPPVWGVIRNSEKKLVFSFIKANGSKLKFIKYKLNNVEMIDGIHSLFDSNISDSEKITLAKHGNSNILIASSAGKLFHIINTSVKPRIVFSQNLQSLKINRILRIIPH